MNYIFETDCKQWHTKYIISGNDERMEMNRLRIKEIHPIELSFKMNEAISLPNKVSVNLENGKQIDLHVKWDEFEQDHFRETGDYQLKGHVYLQDFPNPLVEQRADPYIYKHTDGYYYFTGSYPLYDRIVLRRAKTIAGLKNAEEHTIWWKHEEGEMGNHIWAPELHLIDGKWYIHFAAGQSDDEWAIRPYVLECADVDPIRGTWEEKGRINTNYQGFSLDATTFEHRGKRYLVWAQNNPNSNLYIAEMESPWRIKGEQILITQPEYDWECNGFKVKEGAALIKKNGKLFLTYSGSATDHHYAMGVLIADENSDLLNPQSWKKSSTPIFVTNEEAEEFGPGHNSFTIAEDGETDLLVYHARPYKEIKGNSLYDHNRHASVQEVFWDQDGQLFLGKPGQKLDSSNTRVVALIHRK